MSNLRSRTGVITKKLGMTTFFDDSTGEAFPATILQLVDNYVIGNKTVQKDGYNAAVIAYDEKDQAKARKTTHKLKTDLGMKFFNRVKEFRLNPEVSLSLEAGKKLSLKHFVEGQLIDVTSRSIGKGFAGSMKRHNFSGLEATHGVSVAHRSHGSTGQRQDPGRVFRGKKMAGHMGDAMVTVHNLEIIQIDEELSLLVVLGAVPGAKNSYVYVNDAVKAYVPDNAPYPTAYVEEESDALNASEEKQGESNAVRVDEVESAELQDGAISANEKNS